MKTSIKHLLLTALATVAAISCEKEPEAPAKKATRAEVTISNYFNEDGAKSMISWNTRDVVAFVNTSSATPEVVTASPITPNTQTSRFMFSSDAKAGDKIAAYYPAASATFEGGVIKANLSTSQNGKVTPFYAGCAEFVESTQNPTKISLNPVWCTMYAKVSLGDYAIKKAVLKGNNNEKIAGNVSINPADMSIAASEETVTVEFATAVDCRLNGFSFPILIAPVTFTKGYTVVFTTDAGEEITYSTEESTEAKMSDKVDMGGAQGNQSTQLLVCGDNHLYHIDAKIAATKGFESAVIWHWDSKSVMNVIGKDGLRLDDCKPVDNNTKVLVTSSRGFAVLLEKETSEMLWYSSSSTNAHSAELLPGDRIAVACSDGGDCVQIFDIAQSNKPLFSTPLVSAHGVVWNEKHQRLYAIGGTSLNVYKLTDWETSLPKLTLEKTISTKDYVTGLHDLTYVDPNTLLIAGKWCALYDISRNSFIKLARFNSSHSIKSVNYNSTTGECWYVDATNPEGEFTWSSKTIHYTDNVQSAADDKMTITNIPINMYKCRVLYW